DVTQIVRMHMAHRIFEGLDDLIRPEAVHPPGDVVGFENATAHVISPRSKVRRYQAETEFVLARLQRRLRTCTFDGLPDPFGDDTSELDLPSGPGAGSRLLDAECRYPSRVREKRDGGERGNLGCQEIASLVITEQWFGAHIVDDDGLTVPIRVQERLSEHGDRAAARKGRHAIRV